MQEGGRGFGEGSLHRCGWRDREPRAGSLDHQARSIDMLALMLFSINGILDMSESKTYDNGTLAPASIPVPTDEAQPVALAPNSRSHRHLRVQLHAHLEVAFKHWRRDGIGVAHLRTTLEATIDHGIEVALLRSFGRRGLDRSAVDSFVENRVVGIVFLHGAQVVGTLEEMLALARGVFGADGLAVDALRRKTLYRY